MRELADPSGAATAVSLFRQLVKQELCSTLGTGLTGTLENFSGKWISDDARVYMTDRPRLCQCQSTI